MSSSINKKILIMTFVLLLCLGTFGCGEKSATESDVEMVYVPEFQEVASGFEWISHILVDEDTITFQGAVHNEASGKNDILVKRINIATPQQADTMLILGDNTSLYGLAAMSDGYVTLIEEYVETENTYSFVYRIETYDVDFNKLTEKDVTEALAEAVNSYGRISAPHLTIDRDGNIYICTDTMIVVLDSAGSVIYDISLGDRYFITTMKATKEGQVFVTYEDYGTWEYFVKFIDFENQTLGEALENIPNAEEGIEIYPVADEKLYISTPSQLYRYDIETQQSEELLKWSECDLVGNDIDECVVLNDETILVLDELIGTIHAAKLKRVPVDSVIPKKELTLAILYADSEVKQWVVDFNRSNLNYRINIKAYVNDDYSNYDEALMQFNIDMALGNKADIIIFPNGTDISMYASRGALVDLNEFMETDPEIQKEGFIPNILDTLSVNDKLYAIGDQFDVRSLVGKVSDVGTDSSWTIADVKALVEANPDKLLINLLSQEYGLRFFLEYSMDSFYDEQSGRYDFEPREFRELLELVATFPKEYEWTEKELLIHDMHVSNYYMIQVYEELYGEPVNMTGYPVESGSGHIAEFNMLMAIGARSQNKEGAWQFIRQFLTPEAQCQTRWGFPISKQAFEEWIADAMTPVAEESQNRMVFDNVEVILDELTEERAELIRDTVYGVTSRHIQNEQLYNIIAEEAGAYFAEQKTVDEVIEIIQNRTQVYEMENQ